MRNQARQTEKSVILLNPVVLTILERGDILQATVSRLQLRLGRPRSEVVPEAFLVAQDIHKSFDQHKVRRKKGGPWILI